ncbi:MAG: hypothetical protein PUF93_01040 [Lachnospiraceae bacterium]|nr:hypothetical protein [Lachnospiraceae bacterium]
MVHIVLAILKIIGIILLIVLGIAAALVLLVLFWPVEYQISLRKEDQPFEAEGRAGWLFHLLSADVQIRERTGTITLKVFGRRLKTYRIPEGRKAEASHSQGASTAEAEPHSQETSGAEAEPHSQGASGAEAEPRSQGASGAEPRSQTSSGTASAARENEAERQRARETNPAGRKMKPGRKAASAGNRPRKWAGWIRKAAGIAAGMIRKAAKGLPTAMAFVLRMQELPSDIGDFSDSFHESTAAKVGSLREKAGPFVSQDAFSLYGRIMRNLGRLLRSFRIRRLEGYLLVGTGKPDQTGELVGLLYMIQPVAAGTYELRADFYQAALKIRTDASGHIRMNHVLMFLIRLLRDKEFRKLLAHVRRKGKEGPKGRPGKKRKRR